MPSNIIQWFPGHMAKTRRLIGENLQKVDIVIELLDARIPKSSRNPEIAKICKEKPILTLFNKASLADPAASKAWEAAFRREGQYALFIDCHTGQGIDKILPTVKGILREKVARYEDKGMTGRKLRAMIVGIPNVGKSTLINRLAGSKKAKAEDRPGVTQTLQWVPTSIGIDLLDMPGVLWPKFEDETVGENLAMTGAIKDQILDTESIAAVLCQRLQAVAPAAFAARYKLSREQIETYDKWQLFEAVGRKRGFLIPGGEIDTERTAGILLDEFRACKIGRITLELPEEKTPETEQMEQNDEF
ncbi:MAG: ribosome biogenesis GTPase YlqF [Ruminococcaceae bacterium]|nr:ribosome biogenesis GTPase YlqF [Oscillospiraceae bacterium]